MFTLQEIVEKNGYIYHCKKKKYCELCDTWEEYKSTTKVYIRS